MDEVRNEKWTLDDFERKRQEVLTQWPTGKDVNLEESVRVSSGTRADESV